MRSVALLSWSLSFLVVAACSSSAANRDGQVTGGTVGGSGGGDGDGGGGTVDVPTATGGTVMDAGGTGGSTEIGSSLICSPGETRLCVGPGACSGGQICLASGTWAKCDCGSTAGGAGAGGRALVGGATAAGNSAGAGSTAATGGGAIAGGTSIAGGGMATGGTLDVGGRTAAGGALSTGGTAGTAEGTGGAAGSGGARSTGGTGAAGQAGGATGGVVAGGSTGGLIAATGGLSSLPKFVGNITTSDSCDTSGKIFSRHWDQITPYTAGMWGAVQPTARTSTFNWRTLDAIYAYAQTNGLIFKQHAFIWGAQQPSDESTITEVEVKNWMQAFCARYPNTRLIDVVGEPPPHTTPKYANAIGGGTNGDWRWITNAFKWAREYCPGAVLILDDYNNIETSSENAHFIDIVNKIKADGAPIDAVGAQAHGLTKLASTTMQGLLAKLHTDTGLPVYITQYDIGLADDAEQLAKYSDHFSTFLQADYVRGITVWGWIVGKTWISTSGLIQTDGSARPAMTWLMTTLNRPQP
jgi:endo-1,4-beta-xylanase